MLSYPYERRFIMKCIYCGCEDSKVLDSRSTDESNSIRRRRECLNCGKRFTTYETVETVPILVVKKDGSRQPFNIEKIKCGMIKACEKRPVSMAQIDEMAEDIEKSIQNSLRQEVSSQEIGEMIMARLKRRMKSPMSASPPSIANSKMLQTSSNLLLRCKLSKTKIVKIKINSIKNDKVYFFVIFNKQTISFPCLCP